MPSRFIEALLGSRLPIIMEVKRQDADGGQLMGERTVADVVAAYTQVGAPCISVVTGKWFGGTQDMLSEVAALTDKPILQKDFITRERQILKAKETGAAAVLLTARILPRSTFQNLIETTLAHGLTPFVEVAEPQEVESVIRPQECIVAANNKDIRTQEREAGDLGVSRSLLEAIIATGTPCPVSASAITDPRIGAELIAAGFKGLLIGTGLLQADSVQGWVEDFGRRRAALGQATVS